MNEEARLLVRNRAGDICEYCRLPQALIRIRHQVDHIIARKHGGGDHGDNLALICQYCNLHKGPNIAGIDPISGDMTALFNPRVDPWSDHFRWSGAAIHGVTAIGRTTIQVLNMNDPLVVTVRAALIAEGVYPTY